MKKKKQLRVFLGLIEIAGYYINLHKGFREIGIESRFFNLYHHPFKYETDESHLATLIIKCNKRIIKTKGIVNGCWKLANIFLKLVFFIGALFKFDAFIFGCSSTFFNFYELPILKFLKKRIIYIFHGSDSRPPYLNGYILVDLIKDDGIEVAAKEIIKSSIEIKRKINKIDKYADIVVNIIPQALYHTRPFVSGLCLGLPNDLSEKTKLIDPNKLSPKKGVRVLHAPSNPVPKGTYKIRAAISKFKELGFEIDYIELVGRPNSDVLNELAQCDFIIDEIYSDTPMAGFATEAAFFGKPAIVGGYYSKFIGQEISQEQIPPSLFCHPDDLYASIEKMIIDKKYRISLGLKAYEFVTNHWKRNLVAQRYLKLITGDFPSEWLKDPQDIRYLHGCGLSEQWAKQVIKNLIDVGGKESLQLADKPILEQLLVEFANS
jgi:hypothetical protein